MVGEWNGGKSVVFLDVCFEVKEDLDRTWCIQGVVLLRTNISVIIDNRSHVTVFRVSL